MLVSARGCDPPGAKVGLGQPHGSPLLAQQSPRLVDFGTAASPLPRASSAGCHARVGALPTSVSRPGLSSHSQPLGDFSGWSLQPGYPYPTTSRVILKLPSAAASGCKDERTGSWGLLGRANLAAILHHAAATAGAPARLLTQLQQPPWCLEALRVLVAALAILRVGDRTRSPWPSSLALDLQPVQMFFLISFFPLARETPPQKRFLSRRRSDSWQGQWRINQHFRFS